MGNIKEKIKRMLLWNPGDRLVAAGVVLLLILTLVPLLRLAVYAVPQYDDYNYGITVKNFLSEEYSLKSALHGAFETARVNWYAWQGTFSSIFFMSLMPAVWGEQYYFLGPVFLIILLAVSVFLFTWTIIRNVLKAGRTSAVTMSAICSCMAVMLVYTAQSGFYWYNAGVHYIGMHSFLLLLVSGWIRLIEGKGKTASVCLVLWSMLGAVLTGGANFVTALQSVLLGASIAALGLFLKKKRTLLLTPSLLILAVSFYKNISAPGNTVRKNIYDDVGYTKDAVYAITHSFTEAFCYVAKFSGWITLVILILLIPIIWRMLRETEFRFRYPGIVLLWSFCLYATGFTPSLYSLGHAGLSRTLNAVKITYQLLLILNEVYILGWLKQKADGKGDLRLRGKSLQSIGKKESAGGSLWFYLLMGMLALLIFSLEPNQAGSFSAYGAYYYVHSGEAFNFHQEYEARIETIRNGGDDVVVEPYHYMPWFLGSHDISENADDEENVSIAKWYGKNSVSCKEKDAE